MSKDKTEKNLAKRIKKVQHNINRMNKGKELYNHHKIRILVQKNNPTQTSKKNIEKIQIIAPVKDKIATEEVSNQKKI
jgi:hypothetical protein